MNARWGDGWRLKGAGAADSSRIEDGEISGGSGREPAAVGEAETVGRLGGDLANCAGKGEVLSLSGELAEEGGKGSGETWMRALGDVEAVGNDGAEWVREQGTEVGVALVECDDGDLAL